MAREKLKKFGINFDIGYYMEVNAENEDDAIEKAKKILYKEGIDSEKITEGSSHNWEATEI